MAELHFWPKRGQWDPMWSEFDSIWIKFDPNWVKLGHNEAQSTIYKLPINRPSGRYVILYKYRLDICSVLYIALDGNQVDDLPAATAKKRNDHNSWLVSMLNFT